MKVEARSLFPSWPSLLTYLQQWHVTSHWWSSPAVWQQRLLLSSGCACSLSGTPSYSVRSAESSAWQLVWSSLTQTSPHLRRKLVSFVCGSRLLLPCSFWISTTSERHTKLSQISSYGKWLFWHWPDSSAEFSLPLPAVAWTSAASVCWLFSSGSVRKRQHQLPLY